jgi:hypothetical protein
MAVYQTAPYSPEYSQISARYAARCLSGASPGPAAYSAPYQAPYTSYQQPVAVFPGAVIVGGQEGGYRYDGEGRYR